MTTITETFGKMLKRLRTEARLSLRNLGYQADIPHSAIAAFEADRQNIGIKQAEKLAAVLKPQDKGTFLMKAVGTTKRERILPLASGYPAEILNGLAIYLAHAGIASEDIADCFFANSPYDESNVDRTFVTRAMDQVKNGNSHRIHVIRDGGPLPGPALVIQIKRGRRFVLTVGAEEI